jgi:hypothetical protein
MNAVDDTFGRNKFCIEVMQHNTCIPHGLLCTLLPGVNVIIFYAGNWE